VGFLRRSRGAVATQAIVIAWFFVMIALAGIEMTRPQRPYLGIGLTIVFRGVRHAALPQFSPGNAGMRGAGDVHVADPARPATGAPFVGPCG
jgi:hypothetical protein